MQQLVNAGHRITSSISEAAEVQRETDHDLLSVVGHGSNPQSHIWWSCVVGRAGENFGVTKDPDCG